VLIAEVNVSYAFMMHLILLFFLAVIHNVNAELCTTTHRRLNCLMFSIFGLCELHINLNFQGFYVFDVR
jgi:hypothetical protein